MGDTSQEINGEMLSMNVGKIGSLTLILLMIMNGKNTGTFLMKKTKISNYQGLCVFISIIVRMILAPIYLITIIIWFPCDKLIDLFSYIINWSDKNVVESYTGKRDDRL